MTALILENNLRLKLLTKILNLSFPFLNMDVNFRVLNISICFLPFITLNTYLPNIFLHFCDAYSGTLRGNIALLFKLPQLVTSWDQPQKLKLPAAETLNKSKLE